MQIIFSEVLKQTRQLCTISPNGSMLATVSQQKLTVQEHPSLVVVQNFVLDEPPQLLKWSPDSQFLLCASFKKAVLQVFSLADPEWKCRIDEGSSGLVSAQWAPDSRHILTTSEFYIRMTVWSLINKSISYIRYIKELADPAAFSADGKYLAVAERRDSRDHVSVLSCDTWELIKNFVPDTQDLAGVSWSPECRLLCVWDNLLQYNVVVYTLDGQCRGEFRKKDWSLSIKSVAWSPTGQFLAIGGYDQKLTILNYITWSPVAEHLHASSSIERDTVVYKECSVVSSRGVPNLPSSPAATKYEIQANHSEISLPSIKVPPSKPNPKQGVGVIKFSLDNRYIVTVNDNMPCIAWLWDIERLSLQSVLIHNQPIKDLNWDPVEPRLAVCTGGNRFYMWTAEGAMVVPLPSSTENFGVDSVSWHPRGESIHLVGKERMCLCFCGGDRNLTALS